MTHILLSMRTSSTRSKNFSFYTCLPYKICTTRHDWTFGNGLAKVVSIRLILSFTIGNRLNNTTLFIFIISGVRVSPNWTLALGNHSLSQSIIISLSIRLKNLKFNKNLSKSYNTSLPIRPNSSSRWTVARPTQGATIHPLRN